jgi:hypothetical protein
MSHGTLCDIEIETISYAEDLNRNSVDSKSPVSVCGPVITSPSYQISTKRVALRDLAEEFISFLTREISNVVIAG